MPHFQRISLVHYHELGLKGHNRSTFERHLMRNLSSLLEDAPVEKVTRISGRVLVMYQPSADASEIAEAADLIARVPGVARVSCGFVCDRELDQMYAAADAALSEAESGRTSQPHRFRNRLHGDESAGRSVSVRALP